MKANNAWFVITAIAYIAYAVLFIYRTSCVVNGERYFALQDDAMIAMQYAKNLAAGYGLVYSPGAERIEGFTCPLWMLYMALCHLLPVSQSKVSLLVQAGGAAFLVLNLFFVRKIAEYISNNSKLISFIAVLFTAFYLPLNVWGLCGMEVSILTCLMTYITWQMLKGLESGIYSKWLYVLMGITTLIRLDSLILCLAMMVFIAVAGGEKVRKSLVWGIGIIFAFVLVQTQFRLMYFGELLPNTYYLKMVGYPLLARIVRGLLVLTTFIYNTNWILFLMPFALLLQRRDKFVIFLLWIFITQLAYSVFVGGDAWEFRGGSNRFVAVVMPGFFVLFACMFKNIVQFMYDAITGGGISLTLTRMQARFYQIVVVGLITASLLSFNIVYLSRNLCEFFLLSPPGILTAYRPWMIGCALVLKHITNARAKIAVIGAGTIPYFSDRYCVDLLGKVDKVIAHEPMHIPEGEGKYLYFLPGHMKWNYAYSIGVLKPDIIAQLWPPSFEDLARFYSYKEAYQYFRGEYRLVRIGNFSFFVLKNSPNILWNKLGKD